MDSGPARFFAPYAHVVFDFWEEYVEISLLDDLGGEVKRSGEMSVVITEEEKSFVTLPVIELRRQGTTVGPLTFL